MTYSPLTYPPHSLVLYTLAGIALILLVILGWFARAWWGQRRTAARIAQARATLAEKQKQLEREFFEKTSASGKPRGLTWVDCDFHAGALLAYDSATDEIYALRSVTIRFEATPGGDMEEVEAVGNLRYATAVFVYRGKDWTTDGRVVFNLSPQETLQRYHESLTPLAA